MPNKLVIRKMRGGGGAAYNEKKDPLERPQGKINDVIYQVAAYKRWDERRQIR